MRVLLPGPAGPDTFVDNVFMTLKAMGHDPSLMPSVLHGRLLRQLGAAARPLQDRALRRWLPSAHDLLLRAEVRRIRPDLVLFLTWNVHPEILADISRVSKSVLWWADPPSNAYRTTLIDRSWHGVFLKDGDAVAKLRAIGIDAQVLHEAMNPAWHRPMSGRANDSIAVAGNFYSYRQALCVQIESRGVPLALYGPKPPIWAPASVRLNWSGRYIVREEKSKIFGEALACLNSFSFAEGNSLNCRAFEIAGSGGLQIIEHRSAIEQCFVPDEEIACFRSEEELFSLIERAQKDPAWTKRIREGGARRAAAEHRYEDRLRKLLSFLT